MSITGSIQLGHLLGNAVVQQMTNFLKKTNPEIDPRALKILRKRGNDFDARGNGREGILSTTYLSNL